MALPASGGIWGLVTTCTPYVSVCRYCGLLPGTRETLSLPRLLRLLPVLESARRPSPFGLKKLPLLLWPLLLPRALPLLSPLLPLFPWRTLPPLRFLFPPPYLPPPSAATSPVASPSVVSVSPLPATAEVLTSTPPPTTSMSDAVLEGDGNLGALVETDVRVGRRRRPRTTAPLRAKRGVATRKRGTRGGGWGRRGPCFCVPCLVCCGRC